MKPFEFFIKRLLKILECRIIPLSSRELQPEVLAVMYSALCN